MATKTYPYAVIWQGEMIPANTPITVAEEPERMGQKPEQAETTTRKGTGKPARRGGKKNDDAGIDRES